MSFIGFEDVVFHDNPPKPEEYRDLRCSVGFSARSPEGAEKGLAGSLYAVTARHDGKAVGMARIVGDGGCSFLVVDVIVTPQWQGRGVGTVLMARINDWIETHVPPGGTISLLADKPGRGLYEKNGFRFTAPGSLGMKRHIPHR